MIDFQDTERDIFKRMESRDQTLALFDMTRYVRSEIAKLNKTLLDIQADQTHYRAQREEHEQSTTQKIEAVLSKRFDFGVWFRDKVLPTIITIIVLAVLILAFDQP